MDDTEIGGGALTVGFLLVVLVLYREPSQALSAATATPEAIAYFVLGPVMGVIGGVYVALGGPYPTVPLFMLGSYLGVVGLGLTLGGLLSSGLAVATAGGLGAVLLSVGSLLAGLRRAFAALGTATSSLEVEL